MTAAATGPILQPQPDAVMTGVLAVVLAIFGDLYGFELLATVVTVLAAFRLCSFGERVFERLEQVGSQLARHRRVAALSVGVAAFLIRLAILPVDPVPHPVLADEFSHLLLADTFAHGRLTNPSHPLWHSFETLHVIPLPTYNSMYFPGPALLLLLGQVVFGLPWFGVLIGTGMLCGLICWALQAWFPPRWALLGGIIAVLKIGLVSYWIDSYWGGTFAAVGGTLVLGALTRMCRKPSVGLALVLSLGIGMLANSRPYEGLAFCVPVVIYLAAWLFNARWPPLKSKLIRCVAPIAVSLAFVAVGMGTYFAAVTGSPTRLPYQVNQERYGWPMTLPWTKIHYVQHDRKEFAEYFDYELRERMSFQSPSLFFAGIGMRLQQDWRFFVGPALTIPLLFTRRILRARRLRPVFVVGTAVLVAGYAEPHFPHYLAPATLPIFAVIVQGYRHLRRFRFRNIDLGVRLARAIPLILISVVSFRLLSRPLGFEVPRFGGYTSWCCKVDGNVNQDQIVRRLPQGRRHLILVRYSPTHRWVEEWVYNRADIDEARVIWARELGSIQDQKLIQYFHDRQVWRFEPDATPQKLTRLQTVTGTRCCRTNELLPTAKLIGQ